MTKANTVKTATNAKPRVSRKAAAKLNAETLFTAPAVAPEIVAKGAILPDLTQVNAAPAAPVLPSDAEWIDAGFRIGTAEQVAIALRARLEACKPTPEQIDAARRNVIAGYMVSKMTGGNTAENVAAAYALVDGHASTTSAENVKPGKVQRTPEQDRDYAAGKQRWSRTARKLVLEQNDGGAGNKSASGANRRAEETPTPAPKPEATPAPVATTPAAPADMGQLLHACVDVQKAAKALSPAFKALCEGKEDRAEVNGLFIKAFTAWNELCVVLARSPK